ALRQSIEGVADEKKVPVQSVRRDAVRYLREIASKPSVWVIGVARHVLSWVFNRIYDGIEVDEQGLERALNVSREAPVVFCPSHKSHVDYLVMSWVLVERGISPPLVAAGANLSFFPLGTFLRRGGAFFLRRTFKGNKTYAAAFRAYVKKLMREGYSQEFFIEGGRSRTGKLLSPKLGMVAFEVEAFLDGAQDDVYFVPMAIDYEKVVEAREYASELSGGEKKPESIKSLLNAPRVLTARYGRIYLSFEEPISLKDFLVARAGSLAAYDEEKRRAAVRALAQRVTFGISRASTVTPAALLAAALLAHRRRGVTSREVGSRIQFLRQLAAREGARLSKVMEQAPSDPTTIGPINEVLRMFMEDGWVRCQVVGGDAIYSVPDDRRLSLAFYKNNLVHLAVSRSLVAAAVLSLGGKGPTAEVADRALFLSRLLKLEFMFRVGAPFETIFRETLDALVQEGLLLEEGELVLAAP
ncbi:MAG: 1-acyl-sn-glycerol-3-phosphate acyltransferase, partial [Myxococcales bacterium]